MKTTDRDHNNDRHYVVLLKEGDEEAFKTLYEKYASDVYGLSKSILKVNHLSEDIIQNVFIKIWQNKEDLDESRNFKAYLLTIAKNLSLNILARAATDASLKNQILKSTDIAEYSTGQYLQNKEYAKLKANSINSLPPARRRIFLMVREENKSYKEISEELGISVNTVKTQMRKALKTLRDYFSKHADINLLLAAILYFSLC